MLRSLLHSFCVLLGTNDSILQSDNVVMLFLFRAEKVERFCLMWLLIRLEFRCKRGFLPNKENHLSHLPASPSGLEEMIFPPSPHPPRVCLLSPSAAHKYTESFSDS